MKRLFLILLLTFMIPSVTFASPAKEKSKKEEKALEKERAKAKKAAIRKLKTLLTMTYRNWYWDGDIYQGEINHYSAIDLVSGDYFLLISTFILLEEHKDSLSTMLSIVLPESYLPDYEGKENGPKTLKIQGRFEGGEKFETVLRSDNDPYGWFFQPGEIKNVKGETIEPMKDVFSYKKLYIEFRTNLRSRYKGEYKVIGFDISGLGEIYETAKPIFLN